jgi:fibronectin type 3 domain-containing protein
VTLSGNASGSTTSNSSGVYTFTGLANGSYTVTPSNTGYTFTPVNQGVTVNGANVGSVNFTAAAQQAHSAALSWTASTSAVSGYNVYRGSANGGPYTLISTSLVTGLSFTDTNVTSGATYYYVATAVDSNGNESGDSNQVIAVIP